MEDVIPGEPDSEEMQASPEDRAGRLVGYRLPYAIAVLSLPVMAEQILNLLVGLVDTYLTGQYLGSEHLAAIGMISYMLWLVPALISSISIALGPWLRGASEPKTILPLSMLQTRLWGSLCW